MDGAHLPWRIQKITNPAIELETFLRSLPCPPEGLQWEQLPDRTWVLNRINPDTNKTLPELQVSSNPIIIEHTILDADTLQGLSLRYRVSVTDIRRNNCFSGNNIRLFKTLKIPITPGVPFIPQENCHDVTIQMFKNETQENETESKIYLDDNKWNLEAALNAWKQDNKWSQSNRKLMDDKIISATIPGEPLVVKPLEISVVTTVLPKRIIS